VKLGNKSSLGGEIQRSNKRKRNTIQAFFFLLAFVLLNIILYYLTIV
jgi:predicted nucleic acid-binding Zn ribbon protein